MRGQSLQLHHGGELGLTGDGDCRVVTIDLIQQLVLLFCAISPSDVQVQHGKANSSFGNILGLDGAALSFVEDLLLLVLA